MQGQQGGGGMGMLGGLFGAQNININQMHVNVVNREQQVQPAYNGGNPQLANQQGQQPLLLGSDIQAPGEGVRASKEVKKLVDFNDLWIDTGFNIKLNGGATLARPEPRIASNDAYTVVSNMNDYREAYDAVIHIRNGNNKTPILYMMDWKSIDRNKGAEILHHITLLTKLYMNNNDILEGSFLLVLEESGDLEGDDPFHCICDENVGISNSNYYRITVK